MLRPFLFALPILLLAIFARPLLAAMACGALFAIASARTCGWLERKLGKLGGVAPFLVVASVLCFVALPLAFGVKYGRDDISELVEHVKQVESTKVVRQVSKSATGALEKIGVETESTSMMKATRGAIGSTVESFKKIISEGARSTPEMIVDLCFFVFAFFGLLRHRAAVLKMMHKLVPLPNIPRHRLFVAVDDASRSAIVASCITGAIQAGVMLGLLLALKVPGAWLLGMITFFLSFLPVIGTVPVSALATFYLALESQPLQTGIMIAGGFFVGATDNIVRLWVQPKGEAPGVLNLAAIVGGVSMFGIGGLFIGPVVASLAQWGVRELIHLRTRREHEALEPTDLVDGVRTRHDYEPSTAVRKGSGGVTEAGRAAEKGERETRRRDDRRSARRALESRR